MAIPVTNIPVLTGEVAERFIEQCEYNFSQVPTYNNTSFILYTARAGVWIYGFSWRCPREAASFF